jgi:hypothetical protein
MTLLPTFKRTRLVALLLAITSFSCGGDSDGDAVAQARGDISGDGDSSSGDGAGGGRECSADRPHVFAGASVFNCYYGCEAGFADCDDSRENGCEVDLSSADACTSCPAIACLQPELCGASAPTCDTPERLMWSFTTTSRSPVEVGGFATGGEESYVMSLGDIVYEDDGTQLSLPGGQIFRTGPEGGEHLWTSVVGSSEGDPAQVETFGDELVLFGHDGSAIVITSATLEGKQRWTISLPATEWEVEAKRVARDSDGSVYVWLRIDDGTLEVTDQTIDNTGSIDALNVVVALSSEGKVRWVSDHELAIASWETLGEDWLDIAVYNGHVEVLRTGVISRFETASGSYRGDVDLPAQEFGSYAFEHAFMARDADGNLYVASIGNASAARNEPFMPDGVVEGDLADRLRLEVAKYDSSYKTVWRRPLAYNDGQYLRSSDSGTGNLQVVSFTLAANGQLWVLGRSRVAGEQRQFLAGISNDGALTAIRLFDSAQDALIVRASPDGTPYTAGTYENWTYKNMLYDGAGAFVERSVFAN